MKNTDINLIKFNIVNIDKIIYNLNMSVRKIKKSYISCTGYFASYKNKTQVAFESVLERDFYMMLEFDEQVLKYEEQPLSIQYTYPDGNKRRYTPDTLVTYTNKSQRLYEVKYADELKNNKELQIKIEALKTHLHDEHHLRFDVFTDEDINKIYLENLKFLYNYAFIPQDKDKLNNINKILNNTDKITVKQVLNTIESSTSKQLLLLPYIWYYVFLNHKVVNLYKKLTMNTILEKKWC